MVTEISEKNASSIFRVVEYSYYLKQRIRNASDSDMSETPCNLIAEYRSFGEAGCIRLEGIRSFIFSNDQRSRFHRKFGTYISKSVTSLNWVSYTQKQKPLILKME
jgi:hypothetical protein